MLRFVHFGIRTFLVSLLCQRQIKEKTFAKTTRTDIVHTWLVQTPALCESVTASTSPEALHNGPRSYAQCVVLPRRHVLTNDHSDRNSHALRYALFLQIQHVAHYMKAEMKDSYSRNKPTRSLRNKPTKNKRQGNGMIKIGFNA